MQRTLESLQSEVRATPLASYLVAAVPSAAVAGKMIYVSDAATGSIPCFSDGTNWRRLDTRAIVS